jgi:AbrB family looped-hinge helix DNA binding protein
MVEEVRIVFLSSSPYFEIMKATLTSKGQITIPAAIRRKLRLEPGQVLDFDENAPFLKAVPVFDEDEMRSVLGCAKGDLGRNAADWLDETRGPADLPTSG